MSRDVESIDAATTVADALETYFGSTQTRRAWPVVSAGSVIGVVDRAILDASSEGTQHATLGSLFSGRAPDVALAEETCRQIATRLAIHDLERLPVVTDRVSMKLIGIVSRSDLIKPSLAHFDEEHKRERFRRIKPGNGKRKFPPIHST